MTGPVDPRAHWDEAYGNRGVEGVSWFQTEPAMALELIRLLGTDPSGPVLDVGGGASALAGRLVDDGFSDVTVLDISEVALEECRRQLRGRAGIRLIRQDILAWRPDRSYALWHDRAVFHFLTDERERATYLATLSRALAPGGNLVMATFAEDGPSYCSGLPVARYSGETLSQLLGDAFVPVATRREVHTTPAGVTQPFTWIAGRMAPAG